MNKIQILTVLCLLTILFSSSCTTTRIATLQSSNVYPIELFTTRIPEKNYIELAYIQSDGAVLTTPQQLVNDLVKKARKLDADALINIRFDFQAWYPVASGTAINYTSK